MRDLTVLILAAGKGTRMKSKKAKVLHRVGGLPMLEMVVRAARRLSDDVRVVTGHQGADLEEAVHGVEFIAQEEQRGTGHAVKAARESLTGVEGDLLVLPGDAPLISPDTLASLVSFYRKSGFSGAVLTATLEKPDGYGRIVRRGDHEIARIVEHRDADPETRAVREVNTAVCIFDLSTLFGAIEQLRPANAQGEYYLTDVVGILSEEGRRVGALEAADPSETMGVNTRAELAEADRRVRARKCEALMSAGVTIMDPPSAWIDEDVSVGADSVIHPSVALEGRTVLGEDVTVRSFSRITDSRVGDASILMEGSIVDGSELGREVRVGPWAHLRNGAVLEDRAEIGNFVEVKKSRLGQGTKAKHLTYLGDAQLGEGVNVGAGTITCNYDGVRKSTTVIEDGVFIGSDSQLLAPVRVGRGAYVAAGSTIDQDVPADSLAIARSRQVIKEGWAAERKKKSARTPKSAKTPKSVRTPKSVKRKTGRTKDEKGR